jgi:peroxiredoxin
VGIVAVSFNKPEKNAEWAAHEGFQFPLWTDEGKALALHYGAVSSRIAPLPGRITVVLDDEGRVVLRYDDVDVGTHPADVLEDCQALFGASPGSGPSAP